MIHNIANATELTAALSAAAAGDTLRLAGGSYGTFTIRDRLYVGEVRIESADSANPAQFAGLTVRGSSNITLAGLDLGRPLNTGEPEFTTLNTIRDSNNIKLTGVKVHGSLDDNPQNDGRGLLVVNTRGLLVENSLFTELHRGMVVQQSFNVVVRDSEWKTIRSDGINMAAVEGAVIANNDFSDFRPVVPDHGDVIQFTNTGQTRGSKNITIENNRAIITNGSDSPTQGFFISDPGAFGYDNVLIRNNILYGNGAYHGINLDGGRQVQITGNTVLSARGNQNDYWIAVGASEGVVLDGNVTDNILLKDITKLYLGENTNLKLFPSLAAAIPNLSNPLGPADLMITGQGYMDAATVPLAPVSNALATALSGSISPSQSQQAFKPVPIVETVAESQAAVPSFEQVFAAAPVVEPPATVAVETYASEPLWSFRDVIMGHHFAIA